MVAKWIKRLKWMRISKYAIIICLLLSVIFAGFTIYGVNTGNFNVYITGSDVNLAVYMKEDKSDLSSHLSVPTLDDMFNTTYSYLPQDIARQGDGKGLGVKNDDIGKTYFAFSLYLVNLTDRAVDYGMALNVTDVKAGEDGGDVLKALRVAVIDGENNLSTARIYAAEEESEADVEVLNRQLEEVGGYPSDTIPFCSDMQIFDDVFYDFGSAEEVKYTVVMWLEGCDANCIDNLFGGRIKMRLDFAGR